MTAKPMMALHYAAFSRNGSRRLFGVLSATSYDDAAEQLVAMFDIRLTLVGRIPELWIRRTEQEVKAGQRPERVALYLSVAPRNTADGRARVHALHEEEAKRIAACEAAAEAESATDARIITALLESMPASEVIARLTASPALPPVLVPQAVDGASGTRCTGNDGATPCAVTAPYFCANCQAPQT